MAQALNPRRAATPNNETPERGVDPAQRITGVPGARPATPAPDSNVPAQAGGTERRASAALGSPALVEALLKRGDVMMARRDISAARLLYERAATAGEALAATALARTYDPAFLTETGAWGVHSDAALAVAWYRKAVLLGDGGALARVEALEALSDAGQAERRRP